MILKAWGSGLSSLGVGLVVLPGYNRPENDRARAGPARNMHSEDIEPLIDHPDFVVVLSVLGEHQFGIAHFLGARGRAEGSPPNSI